jgi:hypothetical protein
MTRSITVSEGQSFIDIAIQYMGDATKAFDIAALNGYAGITDVPLIGTLLNIPDADISSLSIVNTFAATGVIPASVTDYSDNANSEEGIGFWEIEGDFEVVFELLEGIGNWAIENDFIIE